MQEDVQQHIELASESVASWTRDAVKYVSAASLATQTGTADRKVLAAAELTLEAILSELRALAALGPKAPQGEQAGVGLAQVVSELDLLGRDISRAVATLRDLL